MYKVSPFVQVIGICILLASCSGSNFSGKKKSSSNPGVVAPASDDAKPPSNEPIAASNGSWIENFNVEASTSNTADVVFAVDTSGSMEDEIEAIEKNIESFVKTLEKNQLDFSIAAIGNGEDFNFPQDPRIKLIPEEIDSHDAIGVVSGFLASNEAVRPNSHLNVIIVSDDNGEGDGNLAGDFKAPEGIASLKVHAVVGLAEGEDPNNEDCEIAAVGTEHQSLAKNSKGLIQNICINDWSKLIENLSQSIVQSTQRAFPLQHPVDSSQPLRVMVNGKVLERDASEQAAYDFNAEDNTVYLSSQVALTKDDTVTIEYFGLE